MSCPWAGDALGAFVADAEAATDAYVRGDMDEYLRLVPHDEAFTVLTPYGGPASRYEHRDDSIRASTGFIQSGSAHLEHVETHMWGDTLIVAMTERQHGRVDPPVDTMSLDELMGLMSG